MLIAEIGPASTHAMAKDLKQSVSGIAAERELELNNVWRWILAMYKLMKRQYIARMHLTRRGSGRLSFSVQAQVSAHLQ